MSKTYSKEETRIRELCLLEDKEWSMGNGQCHCCQGLDTGFYLQECDHSYSGENSIGHSKDCKDALRMVELGGEPIFLGCYTPRGALKIEGDRIKEETSKRSKARHDRVLAAISKELSELQEQEQ